VSDHPLMVSRRIIGEQPVVGGTVGRRTLTVYLPKDAPECDVVAVESAVATLLEKGVVIFTIN